MTMAEASPSTIPEVAASAARRWPDRAAFIEGGAVTATFSSFWARCRAIASGLLARGVGDGDRVAIWAPNARDWAAAAVGAMACGAAIVPLNTRMKGREAGDILRRTRARVLFTVGDFLDTDYRALIADEPLPDLAHVVAFDDGGIDVLIAAGRGTEDRAVDAALARVGPGTVSDIIFTSGTTGVPKGAVTTHGRVLPACAIWIENTGLHAEDRYLIVNPFFHTFGLKLGWLVCLMTGAVAIPMPVFDAGEAARVIETLGVTFLPGPPTIFQMLLAEREARPFVCSTLRGGTTGAATVPPTLVERIRDELGIADIVTAYGMTECSVITSCRRGDPSRLIAESCGKALPGHEVVIVDDDGCAVTTGTAGEILVRGPGVMVGYLDDPAATAEAIDASGWLHTGDVGVMDADGYVRITDRKKDMYISGGFNCYPAEVERLLAAHPAIGMAAVVGVPDDRLGEVGHAFVVVRSGRALDEPGFIAWCRANMANYKVPRRLSIVSDLPRNSAGKIVKTQLRDRAASPSLPTEGNKQ